jgi:hypothetical protein
MVVLEGTPPGVASVGGVARVGQVLRQVLAAVALAGFVVACLRLGWWQWQRYHGPGGSLQNLGYTLQWPTFAAFALFMVWRLRRLERRRNQDENEQGSRHDRPAGGRPTHPTGTPAELTEALPDPTAAPTEPAEATLARPTPPATTTDDEADELAAYNRYLAQLNAKERHRGR